MAGPKFTAEQVIDAIKLSEGFVSKAASILGCSVATLYNYKERYPTVKEAWEETYEKRLDFVESQLMKLIRDGNVAATIFYLKTQGKARGWVERIEHSGNDGGPVQSATEVVIRYEESKVM